MNLFKPITFEWWQAGIFKAGMWAVGIAVGAYFHTFFGPLLPELIAIAVICLGYVTYVWLRQ
jgi:hypothetical protein